METRDFLDTIRLFATGVTVVTSGTGGETHGMTANAVMSLSVSPMQMIVCVAKMAKMAGYLKPGSRFTVNLLREDQVAISNHFAGNSRELQPPQFRFIEWSGGSRIEGCLAAMACEVGGIFDGGDHWIVSGLVLAVHSGVEPLRPLIYYNRSYYKLAVSESGPAPERTDLAEGEARVFYDW